MDDATFRAEVEKRIGINEGRRAVKYTDSRGFATVGIGFNLTRPDASDILHSVGTSYGAVMSGAPLTETQIDRIFKICLDPVINQAAASVSGFHTLSDARRFVIIDLVFNLGNAGWLEFGATRTLISGGHFVEAANHLRGTPWFKQVAGRAVRDCNMMESSCWVPA
jgi:GH24 family phage-related lysozyme (muramidase)